jgi:hypothetical protein
VTGAYVARDIRMRIMPPVEAYNEDLFRDVLKAFDNLNGNGPMRKETNSLTISSMNIPIRGCCGLGPGSQLFMVGEDEFAPSVDGQPDGRLVTGSKSGYSARNMATASMRMARMTAGSAAKRAAAVIVSDGRVRLLKSDGFTWYSKLLM